jgi:hypothetical protein
MGQIETIKRYFEEIDEGILDAELFTDDFQFYFPKYGIGHGAEEYRAMAAPVGEKVIKSMSHHRDEFLFVEQGPYVFVEGGSHGVGHDGVEFRSGSTPGGRFVSVFEFEPGGRIRRMHVYLDPDYTGRDAAGFLWGERADARW